MEDLEGLEDERSESEGEIIVNDYVLGDSFITGTYIGDVAKARLSINDAVVSWGGTFNDEGQFSYYVGQRIQVGDNVTLNAYDANELLLQENVEVRVIAQTEGG